MSFLLEILHRHVSIWLFALWKVNQKHCWGIPSVVLGIKVYCFRLQGVPFINLDGLSTLWALLLQTHRSSHCSRLLHAHLGFLAWRWRSILHLIVCQHWLTSCAVALEGCHTPLLFGWVLCWEVMLWKMCSRPEHLAANLLVWWLTCRFSSAIWFDEATGCSWI